LSENRAVYEIMRKSVVEPHRSDDNTMWRMRLVCSITRATDTHSEYITFNAFPPQQLLVERNSASRQMYIPCLTAVN